MKESTMNGPSIAESGPWSLGTMIGFPIAVLVTLLLIGFGIWSLRRRKNADRYDRGFFLWAGLASLASALTLAIGIASPIGMYPYEGQYHQFREVSGIVEKIDSRLISTGDSSMETKFAVRYEGSDLQFGCDDTRCASVDVGDTLTLSCKRAWQYTGTDGYDCRFTSNLPG